MCGIFGCLTTDDRLAASPATLDAAVRALRHRGPDGSGTRVSGPGPVRCGLAHTRLAILDRSDAAAQPMTTGDGRYAIVYNGEVYGFAARRRDIESRGERFRSTGDTIDMQWTDGPFVTTRIDVVTSRGLCLGRLGLLN